MDRFVAGIIFSCALIAGADIVAAAESKTAARQKQAAARTAEKSPNAIVASVNEEIITALDVEKRMRFIMATTGIDDTAETREKLRRQVIRSLIDERLQMQEAAKSNISVTPADIAAAIASIEQQRNMPPGTLEPLLQEKNVPTDTFQNQLRAQVSWSKLVSQKMRGNVKVTEAEIERARATFGKSGGVQEIQIALLTLPVDKPAQEPEVKKAIDRLYGEIMKGASFEQVARQFAGGKAEGGATVQAFWVNPSQLEPNLAAALNRLKDGQSTPVLRTPAGFTLVKLLGRRAAAGDAQDDVEVTFKDIMLRHKNENSQDAEAMMQIADLTAKHPGDCKDPGLADIGDVSAFNIEVQFRTELLSALPGEVRAVIKSLQEGQVSPPLPSAEGTRLMMLCALKPIPATQAEKERIFSALQRQKLELEAQKYMRNLRREAFVEVK